MTTGIYKLNFKDTAKVYIGQAVDIEKRFTLHKRKFVTNTHTSKLNNAYKLYGMPSLEILIECESNLLDENENEAIEIYDAVLNGFNTLSKAEECPNGKTNWGDNSGRAKYTNEEIILVFKAICEKPLKPLSEISKKLNVSYPVVTKIATGHSHKWLSGVFPIEYTEMINNTGNRNSIGSCAKTKGINYPLIKDQQGQIFKIEHLTNFCKANNLDHSTLSKVLRGDRKQHKKWSLA